MSITRAILSIDLGTTGCKAILFSIDGIALSDGHAEIRTWYAKTLWAEQDANDWWEAVRAAVATCMEVAPTHELLAIGLSSQRDTVVPIDREGKALAPAMLWMDRRSVHETERLVEEFGRDFLIEKTGLIPDATFTATKLRWWRDHCPEMLREAWKFLQPRDYIAWRLTGRVITDHSLAGRTMMYDIENYAWLDDVVRATGVSPDQLPEVVSSLDIVGNVTKTSAIWLGVPSGVPVVAGGGDRACEALGLGIGGNRVMESTGTTTNVTAVVEGLPDIRRGVAICSCHLVPGYWLIEQGMTTAGSIMRWFRDHVLTPDSTTLDYEMIDRIASDAPVGAAGLLLLPFFMGARATRWNSDAVGALFGLTLHHDRGHIARAIMEGVAFEVRACLEVLQLLRGAQSFELWLTGGGAKAALWRQIKADATGSRMAIPSVTEGACLGAMVAAGTGIGLFSNPIQTARDLNARQTVVEPDNSSYNAYTELYGIYNDLYAHLTTSMSQMSQWKQRWL